MVIRILSALHLVGLCFLLLCKAEGKAENVSTSLAPTPPRGWNSYDSFSWIISEAEFLDNAKFVSQNLLKFGYEYVVVDFLWYRKLEPGASVWSAGHDVIDEWGRPVPDPGRWPSSRGGNGFAGVAKQVHAMDLKFGIHVMRGISTAAVQANTPILGAKGSPNSTSGEPWRATDIAVPGTECKWMSACFMGVNPGSEGGHAFVKSLYNQYASWSVDFIKHDCVFGVEDLRIDEIELVSEAIMETGLPIVYSLSPGVRATPDMGRKVSSMSNMYRVTGDDWDTWSDLQTHFDVARDFAAAGLIGASSARGRSWPDLDMLPLGRLTDPGAAVGPHRPCYLTPAEQRTQVSIAVVGVTLGDGEKPIDVRGDLRAMDTATLTLVTNPSILHINAHSVDNQELLNSAASKLSTSELRLVNCKDKSLPRWALETARSSYEEFRVCWTDKSTSGLKWRKGENPPAECFHWTPLATNDALLSTTASHGTHNYSKMGFVSPSRNRGCLVSNILQVSNTSVQLPRVTENAQCRGDPNQLWQITADGRLVNRDTGLCATVSAGEGERIWIARDPSASVYYVAFFNLGSNATYMSLGIDILVRKFSLFQRVTFLSKLYKMILNAPAIFFEKRTIYWPSHLQRHGWVGPDKLICNGLDLWTMRDLGRVDNSLGAVVESHGAAVFSLTCT